MPRQSLGLNDVGPSKGPERHRREMTPHPTSSLGHLLPKGEGKNFLPSPVGSGKNHWRADARPEQHLPSPWGEGGGHAPPGLRPPKGYWGAVSNFGFGPQAGEGSFSWPVAHREYRLRDLSNFCCLPAEPGDLPTDQYGVTRYRTGAGNTS